MECTKNYLIWMAIVLILVVYLKNYIRLIKLAFILKGPEVTPIVGHIFKMTDNKWLIKTANNVHTYGPIMRVWVFIVPIIFVYEPEDLKVIMGSGRNSKKNIFYSAMHNFLGQGLITSNGYKWKKNRRLIQPYFQMHILETYIKTFSKCSEEMVKSLENKEEIKITTVINDSILKLLHKTIFGISVNNKQDTPFRNGELMLLKRLFKPWLLFESIFQYSELAENEKLQKNNMQKFAQWVLKQRKSGKKAVEGVSLLDMLIEISESSTEFTEEDIINEACTFMLAGQDSVGSALACALFFLAKHQNIQSKVVDELNEIFVGEITSITMKELNSMVYLEQCIKETLRLIPSIPMLARALTEDTNLGNYNIPCGTNIIISPFVTHRLPHVFPNPLVYDPDRFSPENCSKMHPYAFIPFSMGPRNCIGSKFAIMEMKIFICSILRNYHLSLSHKTEDLELVYKVTVRARGGIWLRFKPRSR